MDLDTLNHFVSNNVVEGYFMDKSYSRACEIIDRVTRHNQAWHSLDNSGSTSYGNPSVTAIVKETQERDQLISKMATNIDLLTKRLAESKLK